MNVLALQRETRPERNSKNAYTRVQSQFRSVNTFMSFAPRRLEPIFKPVHYVAPVVPVFRGQLLHVCLPACLPWLFRRELQRLFITVAVTHDIQTWESV